MNSQSKRARILRRVLDFINEGDWDEGDGFLIFGAAAYDKHLGIEFEDSESPTYFDEFLRKLASEIKEVGGANEVAKRISLSPVDRGFGEVDLSTFIEGLSPDQRAYIARTLSSAAENLARVPEPDKKHTKDFSDEMDASLAAEAIDQLENSYRRLATLNEMKRPSTSFDGSEYFEEAHRCELAGQKIAAAVLCRAVLEAALICATDEDGWISQAAVHGRSYIEAMLWEARRLRLIDGDGSRGDGSRFAQGLQVRDAGNAAIHDLLAFHHNFADRVPKIIDGTRKIIEDLFGSKSAA